MIHHLNLPKTKEILVFKLYDNEQIYYIPVLFCVGSVANDSSDICESVNFNICLEMLRHIQKVFVYVETY